MSRFLTRARRAATGLLTAGALAAGLLTATTAAHAAAPPAGTATRYTMTAFTNTSAASGNVRPVVTCRPVAAPGGTGPSE